MHLAGGGFLAGSVEPKVQALSRFVSATGKSASSHRASVPTRRFTEMWGTRLTP